MKQLELFKTKIAKEFGGILLNGKRRGRRPLNSKKPMHLVLKATNSIALLKNSKLVETLIHMYAERAGVKIFDLGIHADHIHLAIGVPDRATYVRWIRAVTSVLVQKFKNLKWRLRPYTRIGEWGRGFARLKAYIWKNRKEGRLMINVFDAVDRFRESFFKPVSRT